MTTPAPTGAAMPYFREYLTEVVRPRVEAALRSIEGGLTEGVWAAVVATLMKDDATADAGALRSLLEQHLGLKLQTRLTAEYAPPPAAPASTPGATSGAEPPDVVTARRRPMTSNPLAQAVLDNRTRF